MYLQHTLMTGWKRGTKGTLQITFFIGHFIILFFVRTKLDSAQLKILSSNLWRCWNVSNLSINTTANIKENSISKCKNLMVKCLIQKLKQLVKWQAQPKSLRNQDYQDKGSLQNLLEIHPREVMTEPSTTETMTSIQTQTKTLTTKMQQKKQKLTKLKIPLTISTETLPQANLSTPTRNSAS